MLNKKSISVVDLASSSLDNINILIALDEQECFRKPLLNFFINLGYPDLNYCADFGERGTHLTELLLKYRTDLLVTNLVLNDKKIFPALLDIYTDPEKRFENLEIIIVSQENRIDFINTVRALSLGRVTEWVLQEDPACFPIQKMQASFVSSLAKIAAQQLQNKPLDQKKSDIKKLAAERPEVALGLLGNNLGAESHALKITALKTVETLITKNDEAANDNILNQVGQLLGKETEFGGATEKEKQEIREALANLFCRNFSRAFIKEHLCSFLFRNVLSLSMKYYILGLLIPVLKKTKVSSARLVIGDVFSTILKNPEPANEIIATLPLADYSSLRKTLIQEILKDGAPDATWIRLVQQIAKTTGDPLRPEAREALAQEKLAREDKHGALGIEKFTQLKN